MSLGLPNKLKVILVGTHKSQLVYSSLKGQLFWVYPVEGYDDKGTVLNKDGLSKIMPLTVISNMEIKLLSKIMMILMILIILLFDYLF